MASKDVFLSRKEKYFDALLKEGNRYLIIMHRLHNCYKTNSIEYKKLLLVMDRYSRYKIQLKEDIEELKEMFGELDDMIDDDESEEEDVNDLQAIDLEEFQEQDDLFLEEQIRYFHSILHQRNVLTNMETIFLQMLNVDGTLMNFQLSAHSKLKVFLKNYCERVQTTLQGNVNFIEILNELKKNQLAKRVQNKYKKLQQLLLNIVEKQKLFTEIEVHLTISETHKEEKTT